MQEKYDLDGEKNDDDYSDYTLAEYAQDSPKDFVETDYKKLLGLKLQKVHNVSETSAGNGSTIVRWWSAACVDPHDETKKGNKGYQILSVIDISNVNGARSVRVKSKDVKSGYGTLQLSRKSNDSQNKKEALKAAFRIAYYSEMSKGGKDVKDNIHRALATIMQKYPNYFSDSLHSNYGTDIGKTNSKKAEEYSDKVYKGKLGSDSEDVEPIERQGSNIATRTSIIKYRTQTINGVTQQIPYVSHTMIGPMKATWKGGTFSYVFTVNGENKAIKLRSDPDGNKVINKSTFQSQYSNKSFYVRIEGEIPADADVKFKINQKDSGGKKNLIKARIVLVSNRKSERFCAQNLGIFSSYVDNGNEPETYPASWTVKPDTKIKIKKVGETDEPVAGVTFDLILNGAVIQTKPTDANGECIFENLQEGTYYVQETLIDHNINNQYSAHAQGKPTFGPIEVDGNSDETIEYEYDQHKYTNLMINKKAKYQNRNVANARFKVQYSEDNVNWKWIDNYTFGKPSTVNFTFNEADADEYATGPDGNITFDNIPVGYYRVKEISVPEPLVTMPQKDNKRWVDDISESLECKPISDAYFDANGNTSRHDFIIYCEDPEIFKISGYVFTPTKATTKSEQGIGKRRSDYQPTDYVVKNATVTLYKKDENGNLVEYYGNALDGETENPVQLTGENGYYEYKVVKKSSDDNENIKPFAIKFTYDSIDFIAMSPHYTDPTAKQEKYSDLKEGATSKAEEEDDWEIRKRYTEIYGGTTPKEELKNGDTFKGKAKYQKERNKTDEENTELTYKWNEVTKDVSGNNIENPGTTGISESICQRNQTGYTTNDEKKYISINKEGKDIHKDNKIESTFYLDGTGKKDIYGKDGYNTIEDYSEKTADGRLNRVNQINLGLVTREQPNLSVTNSLVTVSADINGYTNVYHTTSAELTSNNDGTLGQQVGVTYVKEGNLSAYEVYTSDAQTIADANDPINGNADKRNRKLQLYVTYKIELINKSNSLYSKVNELALFHDVNYTPVTISKKMDDKKENGTKDYGKAKTNAEEEKVELLYNTYSANPDTTKGEKVFSEATRRKVGHKERENEYNITYVNTSNIGDGYIMPAENDKNDKNYEEVYVTYQVADKEIEKMLSEKEQGNKYVPQFRHIAEVNSYTTFEKDAITKEKVLYSGIDKNSAPGNVPEEMTNNKIENKELRGQELRNELMKKRAENISKFDDDTGYAEEFTINFKDKDKERSLEGTVFLDENISQGTGNERTSDGELNENEKEIKNVKVSLVEADLNNNGQIIIKNGKVKERENTLLSNDCKNEITGAQENGSNYKITGFIPGNYVLKYEYGSKIDNKEVYYTLDGKQININALDYKSAVVSKEGFQDYDESTRDKAQWYTDDNPTADDKREGVTRYSEAFDNWEKRKELDYNEMNYKTTDQSDKINETMDSYTPVFAVYVELNTQLDKNQYLPENYNIINMDFGITERAKQQMSISKRVSNIKITLPNGQVLLDGDPRNNKKMSGLKYLAPADGNNGTVNIELDSELIHGSTLELTHEITVNNESENDYYNEGYYKFADNTNENDLVTITPNVYDYVDNNLTFDKNNPEHNQNWAVIDKEKFVNKNANEGQVLVSNEANENIKLKNTIVKYEGEKFNNTRPAQTYTEHLTLTRVLSNSDDDGLTYDNDIEINHGNKTGGRRILIQLARYMEKNKGGIGASSETTTITPPTGEDKDYTIYIVAGLVSLLILASGIIIIKKKVLK